MCWAILSLPSLPSLPGLWTKGEVGAVTMEPFCLPHNSQASGRKGALAAAVMRAK